MKIIFLFAFLTLIKVNVWAQLGLNNPNPDPSAILDIVSEDKGLLIPRMTTANRLAISSPAPSLTIFDTDENKFYYFEAGQWLALNALNRTSGSNDINLQVGNLSIGGNITATGALSVSQLNVTGFSNNALMPTGVICIWSGSLTNIPSGWALCDGSNGTIDLRERFIVGAGGDNPFVTGSTGYPVGDKAGTNKVFLTANETGIRSHNHTITDPGHKHEINNGASSFALWINNEADAGSGSSGNEVSGNIRPSTNDLELTGITINPAVAVNAAQDHENRPPYYALAFIMKLP